MKNKFYQFLKVLGIVLLVVVAIKGYDSLTKPEKRTNLRKISDTPTTENSQILEASPTNYKSYCNLLYDEKIEYLTKTSFTLNGNGYVKFDTKFNHSNGTHQPSKFIVSGGGYRLEGLWRLSTNGRINITDYRVVSGSFDASNNSKSRGSLNIECNGNLKGVLANYNGNSSNLFIKRSN